MNRFSYTHYTSSIIVIMTLLPRSTIFMIHEMKIGVFFFLSILWIFSSLRRCFLIKKAVDALCNEKKYEEKNKLKKFQSLLIKSKKKKSHSNLSACNWQMIYKMPWSCRCFFLLLNIHKKNFKICMMINCLYNLEENNIFLKLLQKLFWCIYSLGRYIVSTSDMAKVTRQCDSIRHIGITPQPKQHACK